MSDDNILVPSSQPETPTAKALNSDVDARLAAIHRCPGCRNKGFPDTDCPTCGRRRVVALPVVQDEAPKARHPLQGWPLPWRYDTLKEKVFAADGHEVADFGGTDRSEQDELAHWFVSVANTLGASRPSPAPVERLYEVKKQLWMMERAIGGSPWISELATNLDRAIAEVESWAVGPSPAPKETL